ncbi:response regulator transcription factor [Adhaeribacter pallidiroseus]|uniref:Chemotaxis response regulator protein-glutamate methylesterase of group 1 operon n=1 Tax=Adhaeribacter pallidiroseus TaxID=2072847 RepID=A0A369Q9B7_9BACT|nr:response regulator transcription factor [Adhaeribacter pallidiroseus]RDC61483.1 Chemotaxis response regulator protein-glutamate methylesterase of group 1 operon [Adhaeribacter pallidiroseus]
MTKIKVLLADDHTLVRNGIRSLLENSADLEIVGEAQNGAEALTKVKELAPDVLLIDIAMPVMTGIEATAQISKLYPETRCLVLSMHHDEDYILKSVEAGAYGYLLKDNTREEMLQAIRSVAVGEKYFGPSVSNVIVASYLQKLKEPETSSAPKKKLSKQEKAVLKFIVEGSNSREIAEKLNLSVRTVDNHRASMMKRLKVKNAVELVRKALDEKLV